MELMKSMQEILNKSLLEGDTFTKLKETIEIVSEQAGSIIKNMLYLILSSLS